MSLSISFLVHGILLLLFLFITINLEYPVQDYIELSFGNSGISSSSGAKGILIENSEQKISSDAANRASVKKEIIKEIELPKAKNTDAENVIKPVEKTKEVNKEKSSSSEEQSDSKLTSKAQGNEIDGKGSFGFDIDWGGKGKRQIWSYPLPNYPAGVYKEIDIKIMFTIKPDGSVGSTRLLTKADTKLENAALNSLRQWRFEPLSSTQKQIDQTAVIVFPYRLE